MTLGYVRADDGRYAAEPVVERLLVRSSPESIASFAGPRPSCTGTSCGPWTRRSAAVEPYRLHEDRQDDPAWEGYMRGLFEISRAEQDANAALVPVEDPRSLVDVAGGHGGFSMAMCRRHERLRATIVDLPAAAAVGRRIVAEQGFSDRIDFREGDVFERRSRGGPRRRLGLQPRPPPARGARPRARAHWRARRCDPAACSSWATRRSRCPARPSEHGALSSLLFYAWSGGRNFEGREIAGWLEEAGFADVEVHRNDTSPWRIVVIGSAP